MIKKFLLSGLLILSFMACKKDKESAKIPYEGQWNLTSFTQDGNTENYYPGDIIWEFNKYDELIVQMDTVLPASSRLPIKTPGTYAYTGAAFTVSINRVQYAVEIENDTLMLSHNPATGGPLLKFYHLLQD